MYAIDFYFNYLIVFLEVEFFTLRFGAFGQFTPYYRNGQKVDSKSTLSSWTTRDGG